MTQIIAHRGFSGRYPENTIPAIQAAIALGVDRVEIDIHETADGELIVFHDYRLMRICGVRGRVRDITFARLRRLNPAIPTLAEVLTTCRGRFLIEIKRADPLKVAAQVRGQDVILFSLARQRLEQLVDPALVRFGLFARRIQRLRVPIAGVAVHQRLVRSRQSVEKIHRRGWQLFVWTVNRPADMRRYIEWGVDGLITNYPDIALNLR
ncbi:MAG: Glycerophosphodiester phosphodiesterase [Verrucomicrobiae bacterium]|nr:Glycerophosphodiester phosphodiesterase [Verrucomicrobiae bacterium]